MAPSSARYDELVDLVRRGFHWDNLIHFCAVVAEDGCVVARAIPAVDAKRSEDAQRRY